MGRTKPWISWHKGKAGEFAYLRVPGTRGTRTVALGLVTPEEANLRLAEITRTAGLSRAAAGPRARTDAATALKGFLDSCRVQKLADRTIDFYEQRLGLAFAALGPKPMAKWGPSDLEGYIAAHPDWSPRTVRMVIFSCRRFLRWATTAGRNLAVGDFASGVRAPRRKKVSGRAYHPEEAAAILARARYERDNPHPVFGAAGALELPIALATFAGLAYIDFVELDWSEVDLVAKEIRRRRSKTENPKPLLIPAPLLEVLKRNRATTGPVCRDLPKEYPAARQLLQRLLARAGIRPERRGSFHQFRRTYGTGLARQPGVTVRDVADGLQQANGSTATLDYIVDDASSVLRDAVEGAAKRITG